MRTRTRDPQPLAGAGILNRMGRILAARGIDPTATSADDPATTPPQHSFAAGVPPRYRYAVADHPQILAWVQEVATHAAAPSIGARRQVATGPSLLMAGVTGAGKTHQAYGAVRALAEAGVGVRWRAITAADLYALLRPRAGADTERELAAICRVPVLILDDLGAPRASEWVEEITYRLVNHRYNHMLPTVFTTNLAITELRVHVGDRVASRLAQMTTRVAFDRVDRRRSREI